MQEVCFALFLGAALKPLIWVVIVKQNLPPIYPVWKSLTVNTPLWAIKATHDMWFSETDAFDSTQQDIGGVFEDFDGDKTTDISVTNTSREDFVMRKPQKEDLSCVDDPEWHLLRKLLIRTHQFRVITRRLLHCHNLSSMVHANELISTEIEMFWLWILIRASRCISKFWQATKTISRYIPQLRACILWWWKSGCRFRQRWCRYNRFLRFWW